MKRRINLRGAVFACFVVLFSAASAVSQTKPAKPLAVTQANVRIPMRDGVTLAAEVIRPDGPGRFPTLFLLRYWQTGPGEARFFAQHGYACVLADSRGRGGSGGKWNPYVNEPRDGHDALQWIGQQSWCNGRIGTFGQSYNGFTQLMPAPLGSPFLKCLFPREAQQSCFGHLYNDGVLQLNVVFTFGLYANGPTAIGPHKAITDPHFRRLPLLKVVEEFPAAYYVKDWLQHARYDDYWTSFGIKDKYAQIKAPAYFITGWYDNLVHENWRNFLGFRHEGGSPEARQGTKIMVGPWTHGGSGGLLDLQLRWNDYWLKGIQNGLDKEAPIKIFVMGANQWRSENEWPLARTRFTRYYLASGGKANSARGDGTLSLAAPPQKSPPDAFVYDPDNPVFTLGGQISTNPEIWGPKDRRSVQQRPDVLVYQSEPLARDLEVTGPVELKLYAVSSAVNTDFTATLSDLHPDGRAIHICEGIKGVTFRESLARPRLIEPGKVYEYTISLWETSNVFKAGHRLVLEVSSSNFPRYARNQNTAHPLGTSAEIHKARQTILHDASHPSHLTLPVIP